MKKQSLSDKMNRLFEEVKEPKFETHKDFEAFVIHNSMMFRKIRELERKAVQELKEEIDRLVYSSSEIYLPQTKLIKEKIDHIFGEELSK